MGEVEKTIPRDRIVALILHDNPKARLDDVELYADAFTTYHEAAENIARNGAIVGHPRTAAPIDNPYLKVRAGAMAAMMKLKRLRNLYALWTAQKEHIAAVKAPEFAAPELPAKASQRKKNYKIVK